VLILKERANKILKYSQIIFYLAFLFLWFKDNFPILKKINLSYLIPLIPLVVFTVIRILLGFRQKKIKLRIRFDKVFFTLVALILIATAIRIPFLVYNFGLLTSDDAFSALLAKHISEGRLSPIYHYGVDYIGTFSYHIYALAFSLFGFSIFIIVLLYFTFYLGFIMIQFLFFKEIFSSYNLSLVLSAFYCLPIGNLFAVSFFVSSNLSLTLFLGSLSMYLSFLVYKKNKENLIPLIGFCLGLSFWIHPATIYFSICSFIFIVLKYKLILKGYLKLIIYFLIGIFPVILYEIFNMFSTFRFLFSGAKFREAPWAKIKTIVVNLRFLISEEKIFFNYIYILLIFLGIIGIIYISLKRRRFLPENIFIIFFIVVVIFYSFSKFPADITRIRYLYSFYFALPVLLVSIFNLLRKKIKYTFIFILFSIIFFSSLKGTYSNYLQVKRAHFNLKKIISTMEMTGERYWAGDFWLVILITGLSGEKIVGYSYPHEHYFPYKLWYFNRGDNNNFIFFKETGSYAIRYEEFLQLIDKNLDRNFNQANSLINLLDKMSVKTEKKKVGDYCWLIYDISGQVFPWTIKAAIPEQIPELKLTEIKDSKGYLFITFKREEATEVSGFWLHVRNKVLPELYGHESSFHYSGTCLFSSSREAAREEAKGCLSIRFWS